MNPGSIEADNMQIAHLHAPNWDTWRARLDYRLEKGAYRAELSAGEPSKSGAPPLHFQLHKLLAEQGEAGLREFFDEVAMDTPALRERLDEKGLLRLHPLELDTKLSNHFPALRENSSTV